MCKANLTKAVHARAQVWLLLPCPVCKLFAMFQLSLMWFPVGVEKNWAAVLGTNLWECISGFMEVSAKEKRTITKNRLFVKVLFWSCLSHVEGYVGLRLGNWRSKLGPCGVPWRSLVWKNQPQPKTFRLRFILGALGGLCRTIVGPFWVYVGPMLGHVGSFGGLYGFHGGLWWSMLGVCWAYVGAMLGPCCNMYIYICTYISVHLLTSFLPWFLTSRVMPALFYF